MKNILIVLAPENFRDEEYSVPRKVWEEKGIAVSTTSSALVSVGRFGMEVKNDFLLENARAEDFDAIFFVGGEGCLDFLENKTAQSLAENFVKQGRVVGAICAAPRLLLHWKILKGKRCTGWNGDNLFESLAKKGEAIYEKSPVVGDGKFFTGDGPESAEAFARGFSRLLSGV